MARAASEPRSEGEKKVSMPTLQRYKKLYQRREEESQGEPVSGKRASQTSGQSAEAKARRLQRHVTRGASASEIRKALGISQKDFDAVRRDLARLARKTDQS